MNTKLLPNIIWSLYPWKEAAEARLSLHLTKCHIVGNHMSWLICDWFQIVITKSPDHVAHLVTFWPQMYVWPQIQGSQVRPWPGPILSWRFIIKSPDRVAQSVTCLASDVCLTADPGVASSTLTLSHTFMEIYNQVTGPRSTVGNVFGFRCVSDCRSRGC